MLIAHVVTITSVILTLMFEFIGDQTFQIWR